VPAGERNGVAPSGALDMAGNVKEWCSNVAIGGSRRYILGGAWNEPSYRFTDTDAHDPWERDATFGVRLIDTAPISADLDAPIGRITPDPKTVVPPGDAEFEFYKRFYTYDRTPLDARVERVDDSSQDWVRETVSIAAAYGSERIPAFFFRPKHATAPYQTIVYFPSSYARNTPSSAQLDVTMFDFAVKSGRAVLYPVYQGTFERRTGATSGPNSMRDLYVQWAKDFFREVDYLETRPDVDHGRLAFYGVSMGAYFGPIPVALDSRIKAAVFALGGLRYNYPAEVQPANFMPRVKVPALLINGKDDFSASPEAQARFLELLGSPADQKAHAVFNGGHVPDDRRQVIRATLDWFDRWLGPVR
jgi:dienelactone hydrolase